MASVTSLGQLATQLAPVGSALVKTLGPSLNGTQPAPAAGPSSVGNVLGAAASAFSANLGSTSTSLSALSSIAGNISSIPSSIGDAAGSIASALSSANTVNAASEAISNLTGSFEGLNSIDSAALAEVANGGFADAISAIPGISDIKIFNGLGGLTATAGPCDVPKDWVFITAPGSVSWDKQGETSIVNTYGSNNPYVIYSTTGMRKLSLSECLVEGFSSGKEVEDHVLNLEKLMTMCMDTEKGYVSPYVWDLRAGDKSYGMFIIESVNVTEEMRNKKGRADRARVNISLQQVPDFQINDGRDLATKADLAAGTSLAAETAAKEAPAAEKAAAEAGKPVTDSAAAAAPGDASPSPTAQGRKAGVR